MHAQTLLKCLPSPCPPRLSAPSLPAPTSPAGTCHTRTSREAPRIDSAGAPRVGTGIATRVCFRGDGSAARAGRSGPGPRARADAAAIVAKRIASRPSPTPARVAGLARSKRAVRRSGAARSIPSIAVGYPLRAPRIRGHSRGPRSIKPRVRLTVRPLPLSPRSSTRAVAPAGKNLSARVCVPPRAVPRSSKRPLSPLAEGATQPLGVLAFSRRASRFKTND